MTKRTFLALGAAILALGAIAAWLVSGLGRDAVPSAALPPPVETSPAPPAAPPPAVAPVVAPPEPADREELRRRADYQQAQDRYQSLRSAFEAGKQAGSSRSRMLKALRTLARVPWNVACRGQVCRIDASGLPAAWQEQLRQNEGVQAITDRIEVDPSGEDSAAYALLAQEDAPEGEAPLAALGQRFQSAEATRKCLAESPEKGAAEYELKVDSTGVTYRFSGNLPWPVMQCLNAALADVMLAVPIPPAAKTATRKVALRTPP
jgi:hypothetical protein